MNDEYDEAAKVFGESVKREFSRTEANSIHFKPKDIANRAPSMKIPGKVVDVKAGFSFIESPDYQRFFFPKSRLAGKAMQRDMKVTFEIAFCARGPMADKVELVTQDS